MKIVSYPQCNKALRELQCKFDRTILITDLGGDFGRPISVGVNWSAIGAVPADAPRGASREPVGYMGEMPPRFDILSFEKK